MDTNLLLFILLLVSLYIGCSLWLWRARRSVRQRQSSESSRSRRGRRNPLRIALLGRNEPVPEEEPIDHRIDAVTRDAMEDAKVCARCKFANLQRHRYCALCGEALSESFDVLYNTSPPTGRLEQALRRKEWTRRVDRQGRAFWYRSSVPSSSSLTRGYVVAFTTPSPPTNANASGSSSETVARRLAIEAAAAQLKVLDASEADASMFPNGGSVELKSATSDLLQMAEKPFPTKYSHFVVCSASSLVPPEVEVLKVSVHREYVVEDSVSHLSCMDTKYLRTQMRINFLKESGIDAGGVHREWFMLLSETLVDPKVGLFKCTNEQDQTFSLNAMSEIDNGPDHLAYFYAVGRLVGRALLGGDVLGFHFSRPLLKIMLGVPVTFDDLESVDPVTFKSMLWILQHDDIESLGLDFTVTERVGEALNDVRVIELIPGGSGIQVTDENKLQYLERRLQYTLFESVSTQLYALLKGLYEVVPQSLLMLFDSEEFDLVLCGSQDIDVADWQRNSKCSSNLTDTRVYRWFWEIVRDMPNEYRRRLLQFTTGCSRVPLAGFKGLTSYDGRICLFTLKGVSYDKSQYVRSHACFNRLDLPLYPTREEMKAVIYGTLSTDILGFTTE